MSVASALVGASLVLYILIEAFEALVLPRRVIRPFRFTRLYYRVGWRIWSTAAGLFASPRVQQNLLSWFGPFSLLGLFAVWAAGLILGYGLIQYAVDPRFGSLADALYLSGTTFTTLGYGDITPTTPASRAIAVTEAAMGFGFFAIVISYLPVLYQSFSVRESFIALLDARAGSPPAAGRMLLRIPPTDGRCLDDFLGQSERWAAEVLEAHLSYPVLGYYRSQHDNQSWLAALACILDSCALLLTVVEGVDRVQARLTFAMARHTVVDLGLVLRRTPGAATEDRLSAARLDDLLAALAQAGVKVHDDAPTRARLAELRELYEPVIDGLSRFFRLPIPAMWPIDEKPDNWQTSAWMRQARPLTSLGAERDDDHFR